MDNNQQRFFNAIFISIWSRISSDSLLNFYIRFPRHVKNFPSPLFYQYCYVLLQISDIILSLANSHYCLHKYYTIIFFNCDLMTQKTLEKCIFKKEKKVENLKKRKKSVFFRNLIWTTYMNVTNYSVEYRPWWPRTADYEWI